MDERDCSEQNSALCAGQDDQMPDEACGQHVEPDAEFNEAPHPVESGKDLGKRGEEAAAKYLERQDFEILDRNWTCQYGEADIVAREGDDIVFVEVKTRTNIDSGLPEDAVTPAKRSRYERIAACYLSEHEFIDCCVRFDVISILAVGEGRALLRHHRSAFSHED